MLNVYTINAIAGYQCIMCFSILGLWLHLNIKYTGALQMTLETKINLSKLGKEEAPKAVKEMQAYYVRLVCAEHL